MGVKPVHAKGALGRAFGSKVVLARFLGIICDAGYTRA